MMIPMVDSPAFPSVLYRAHGAVAVAKPAGINVFGASSLATWLMEQHPELASVGPVDQPAFVHRLDRGTSGIILAAEDQGLYEYLRGLFSSSAVIKWYLAVVEGQIEDATTIDKPLGGRYRRSARVWVDDGSRKLRGVRRAVTHIEPVSISESFSLCRIRIPTGTRHQIRAHLAYLGHPVAGDVLYGAQKEPEFGEERFYLHAHSLEFQVPGISSPLVWTCPLIDDFFSLLSSLGLSTEEIRP